MPRYVLIPLALFVYVTVMIIVFIPGSTDSTTEKTLEICLSYFFVVALFFVLRYRERLRKERERDMENSTSSKP